MTSLKKSYIGLDIGGTKIEGILWNGTKIVSWKKIRTPRSRKKIIDAIAALVQSLRANRPIHGIGISLAGAIDTRSGTVVSSPNLQFLNGVNLQTLVKKKTGVKTLVLNDAKCFLLGELSYGSAKGKNNVVGIIIGTGFGGALYLDGRLVYGNHGFAGEQGGMKLFVGGKSYSIEDLISSHGFARLGVSNPLDYQNRAFAGDKKAIALYDEIGKYLGVHLANLVEIFDPELIIIGGGIARARELLLKPAIKEFATRTAFPKKYWPQIKISRLKNAGLLGAVSLLLPHVKGETKRG